MTTAAVHDGLSARGLVAGYAGIPVVRDVDIDVAPGEIVALLGPNGAGKTTTLMALAGELPLHGGSVIFRGAPAVGRLDKRSRAGLGFVPEQRGVLQQLSVIDNLRLGRAEPDRVLDLVPELLALTSRRAGNLSGGEQQLLAVGRALAGRPTVLMVDELSQGLAPIVVERILELIRRVARDGTGVLLVEQHIHHALAVADRVIVLSGGQVVLQRPASVLLDDLDILHTAYLGPTRPTT